MKKSNDWHPILNAKQIKTRKLFMNFTRCMAIALVFLGLGNTGLPSFAQLKQNSQLTVEIDGLKNQKGQICLSLFASSRGFPDNATKAVQNRCLAITAKTLLVTFENLQPGNYAVAVLHDANSDNKANRNGLGIPSEGFGFSENPVILTSPPKFNDAAVLVAGSNTNIQIKLNYLLGG
jgi:uncharacterized protein (DUF2141 family)